MGAKTLPSTIGTLVHIAKTLETSLQESPHHGDMMPKVPADAGSEKPNKSKAIRDLLYRKDS